MIEEKRWKKEFEKDIFQNWISSKEFRFDPKSKKEIFAIDTPPPTANAKWHVGGAGAYSFLDMIARIQRMKGYEVLFPWCSDRNGLPMEVSVEKHHKIKMHETPRDEFIKLAAEWAKNIGDEVTKIAKKMGMVAEYEGDFYYETDKPYYRKITQATFIELWNKGLIYFDDKPNNYCTDCGTTIADAEIEYEDKEVDLIYIKFRVVEGGEIEIATTRPELMAGCAAVLYNPEDERYQKFEGKKIIVPIYDKEVPLMANPYAKKEFGTGLVMVCSYGDYADVRLFRELKLKPVSLIDKMGKMTDAAGKYSGLRVKKARKGIIEELEKNKLVVKIEKTIHRTPVCWRSRTPIEFVSMKEFYLKQVDFRENIREIAKKLKFHPEQYRQSLLDWIDAVSQDWVISRRRYYGTEIPVWYCRKCKKAWLPEPGEYYQPWKNSPPKNAKCKCGSSEFEGETRTFDTWMDSSISELFITGYKRFPELFEKAFPCALRNQGKDIIRSWLYYTLLRAYQLTGKPAFKHVFVNGHGVDENGRKMSKSMGNVVDPLPVLEKYGADAFRLWVASETPVGNDFRYSEMKIQATQKFLTKMWNISRFISGFERKDLGKKCPADGWIIQEMESAIEKCNKGYSDFNFFIPANEIRRFAWNVFADHYIELVKARAYNKENNFSKEEQSAAIETLYFVLEKILKVMAPICPFITEKIWKEIFSEKSIHFENMPEFKGKISSSITEKLVEFNSFVWNYKKENGISLNSMIKEAVAFKELKPLKEDLKGMHNIESLEFGNEIKINRDNIG